MEDLARVLSQAACKGRAADSAKAHRPDIRPGKQALKLFKRFRCPESKGASITYDEKSAAGNTGRLMLSGRGGGRSSLPSTGSTTRK